ACVRPRMEDAGLGEIVVSRLRDPVPRCSGLLATSSGRASPQVRDVVPERIECAAVCRHRMIREVAGHDLPQPFPLFGDWLVHPPSQLLLDFLEPRPHAVAAGFSLEREAPLACLSADEGEA